MTEMDSLVIGPWVVDMPDRNSWAPVADPTTRLEAEGRLGTMDLELCVRIGGVVLDREMFVLLRAMDGQRTVSDLAERLEEDPVKLLRRVLELMRRRWCRWAQPPTCEH